MEYVTNVSDRVKVEIKEKERVGDENVANNEWRQEKGLAFKIVVLSNSVNKRRFLGKTNKTIKTSLIS